MATQYTWTGMAPSQAMEIAKRRLVEGVTTLLGAALPTDVAREASLAELVAAANALVATDVLLNQARQNALYAALGNPAFAINTNFDVKNANAISYLNGGTLKTLSANTNFDTGTAATVAGTKYAAALLTVNSSGTGVVTWFTAAGAGYASEAAAIAAMTAPAATDTVLGYITIQAHASGFTAGTDALTTGTGGNVCTATTYYNSINPNNLMIGAVAT